MTGLIVHEWIEKTGGAEKVLEQFQKVFPDAPMQVLWNDAPELFPEARESWLAQTPLRRHKALALPLLPLIWRTLRAEQQPEWILVSSHLFAHHVSPRGVSPDTPKLSYVHTPARYIWEPELDQRGGNPLIRAAGSLFKPLDRRRAKESTRIAANSEFTRERIRHAWNRDADVIYPPVDVDRIIRGGDWRNHQEGDEISLLTSLPDEFLLGASRFVPYKRLDAVIEAGESTGLPVVLAGRGPGLECLKDRARNAKVPTHVVHSPSDALLFALYQQCLAYVFPAVEDFGIMPVEAMAAGAPVIVPDQGGASESIRLAGGGATVNAFTPSEWKRALEQALEVDRSNLPARAQRFSASRFRDEIRHWVEQTRSEAAEENGSS